MFQQNHEEEKLNQIVIDLHKMLLNMGLDPSNESFWNNQDELNVMRECIKLLFNKKSY